MDYKDAVNTFYEELQPNATFQDAYEAFAEEANEVIDAGEAVANTCDPQCRCVDAAEARMHLAKELGDVIFTAFGLARMAGIDLDDAMWIVANDNNTKVRTESGKVQKPANYFPPDMSPALVETAHGYIPVVR